MTYSAHAITKAIRGFHEDEAGNESLQTVFITAIGALVMFGVFTLWDKTIKPWVEGSVDALAGTDFTF